jgi:hypothetical protein
MSIRVPGATLMLLGAACAGKAPASDTAAVQAPPALTTPPKQLVTGSGPGTNVAHGTIPPKFGPARDSVQAVAVAARFLNNPRDPGGGTTFRVASFLERQGGYIVELSPEPATPGGGGLLWIEHNGRLTVLQRYR